MATTNGGGKYYWTKNREDFWRSDEFNYLIHQYGPWPIIIYFWCCTETMNSDGDFVRRIGEIEERINLEYIKQKAPWISESEYIKAVDALMKVGLLYGNQETNRLQIANFDRLVGGSDKPDAKRKRKQRDRERAAQRDKVTDKVTDNVTIDIRDKNPEKRKSEKSECRLSEARAADATRAGARDLSNDEPDDDLENDDPNWVPF